MLKVWKFVLSMHCLVVEERTKKKWQCEQRPFLPVRETHSGER